MNRETDRPWPVTWSAVSEAQRKIWLEATPAQRLFWAEELLELARLAGSQHDNDREPGAKGPVP